MLCRNSLVVFRHLRVVRAGLRARGNLGREREHAEHVQESSMRGAYGRNRAAKDMLDRNAVL